MNVPMVDLKQQLAGLRDEIRAAIAQVVDSTRFIDGPAVAQLETALAEYIGVDHAIGVSSGTDALVVSMMALDIGPGDRVIVPTYSFFATAGAVARLGATPVFVDIDPATYNIDVGAAARWLEDHRDRAGSVTAIVPVHLFGQCADMDAIADLAERWELAVIEDAAQAIGASHPTRGRAGAMGTVATFSFFPSKNLGAFGDGGLVTTNDEHLAAKIRKLRNHGAAPKYHHALVGGNFRLDTIQAAVLGVKLPHLDDWHRARRDRAARYDRLLEGIVATPRCAYSREHHVFNQYVVEVDGDRDAIRAELAEAGVATSVFYPVPFHLQPCFAELGGEAGDHPHSERAAAQSLALPIYPELSDEQQDYVVAALSTAR